MRDHEIKVGSIINARLCGEDHEPLDDCGICKDVEVEKLTEHVGYIIGVDGKKYLNY